MDYKLTPEDVKSVGAVEEAFGTTKFLPKSESIPEEFFRGNIYTRICDSMFMGSPMPEGKVELKPEFEQKVSFSEILNFIAAHLKSGEPKHENKIAGVGFMMSHILAITEDE